MALGFSETQKKEFHRAFADFLEKQGCRLTRQRAAVLDTVLNLGSHADADTIAIEVRKTNPAIGIATVYRTLALLRASGIVVGQTLGSARTQFEMQYKELHHDHLICKSCGKVVEFYDDELETVKKKVAERLGFVLISHHLELHGYCSNPDCQKSRKMLKSDD